MATAVNLSLLEAMASALRVNLLRNQAVQAAGVGPAYSGFAAAARLEVAVVVTAVPGDASPTLTVTLEGSSDEGATWAQVHEPWVFSTNGSVLASVDGPPDWLRVTWGAGGGLREGFIAEVDVVPASIEQPGGGSGDVVSVVAANGWVKDLAVPAGTTVLILDTRPQAWQAEREYSIANGVVGQQMKGAAVYPTDGVGGEVWFLAYQMSGGESGATEPTWPTEESAVVSDGVLRWSAQSYDPDGWQANTAVGDFGSGLIVEAGSLFGVLSGTTTGAEAPDWSLAPNPGDTVEDNDAVWQNQGPVTTWAAHTDYRFVVGSDHGLWVPWVLPTSPAGFVFGPGQLNSGIYQPSGAEEPEWDTTVGRYTVDGGIVWQASNDTSAWSATVTGIVAPASNSKLLAGLRGNGAFLRDQVGASDFTEGASAEGNGFECRTGSDNHDDFDWNPAGQLMLVYVDDVWRLFGGAGTGPD